MTNVRMLMSTVHPLTITGLSRITRTVSTEVNIGDYLFSDGWWGSLAENLGFANPIAVVFANTTSTTDQGHGWTHGYAMALKNASSNCNVWGPSDTNPTGTYISSSSAMVADLDGYTHTQFINSSTYPPAYAATTIYQSIVAAPGNTSGWYLPSIGQWYAVCKTLGKMTGYINCNTFFYWERGASLCSSNINAYLTPLVSGTYDAFPWNGSSNYLYWCSSEFSITNACCVDFYENGHMFIESTTKTAHNGSYRARSVLAF